MTVMSENVTATSEDFPMMSEDVPTTLITLQIRTDCRHLKAFAIVIKNKKHVVIKLGHKVNIKRLFGVNLIELLLLIMC